MNVSRTAGEELTQELMPRKRQALRLSGEQIEALAPIGKRIRGLWEDANCRAARARSEGNEAVKAALLCGEALLEAKGSLGHGQWLPWLERYCGEVARSMVTAQNWMRIARANTQGVCFLEGAHSLTAAYRMVGILPAFPECAEREAAALTVDGLAKRLSWLTTASKAIATWTLEQRQQAAQELRPLVEFYHQLIPEVA